MNFATSHEHRGPVWSLLNVFSAVRIVFERWQGWEYRATRCRCCSGPLHHWSYYSWDNSSCFLSLCLSLSLLYPVCQSFKPRRDVNRIHGGPPLYILKSQLALGTSSLPLPPILWRSKGLLHKTAIDPGTQSEIINIHGPSVRAQRLLTQSLNQSCKHLGSICEDFKANVVHQLSQFYR